MRVVAAIALVLLVSGTARGEECRATRGGDRWAWRIVDARKCWYPGRAGMDKRRLHWPRQRHDAAPPLPPGDLEPKAVKAYPINTKDEQLRNSCCWPTMEKKQ